MTVAVIIPCFRVKSSILDVINLIGSEVSQIYVIDDGCPDGTGKFVNVECLDPRVVVIHHDVNAGVGAAVMTGYKAALAAGHKILVKLDGDGQMDPKDINSLVQPIDKGFADYCKGNRFYFPSDSASMPPLRFFGNLSLSFITKASTGYWQIFDPTNGFTAIHSSVVNLLPMKKISNRYFFESDMLFRLSLLRAVVMDIPMKSRYGKETSHLVEYKVATEFFYKNTINFVKRIVYLYYLRDFSFPSLQLIIGFFLFSAGFLVGLFHWWRSYDLGIEASAGTVMISALPIILGFQLLLNFFAADISYYPRQPIHLIIDKKLLNSS